MASKMLCGTLERCEGLLRLPPAGAVVPLPPPALPLRVAGSAQCSAADVATRPVEYRPGCIVAAPDILQLSPTENGFQVWDTPLQMDQV